LTAGRRNKTFASWRVLQLPPTQIAYSYAREQPTDIIRRCTRSAHAIRQATGTKGDSLKSAMGAMAIFLCAYSTNYPDPEERSSGHVYAVVLPDALTGTRTIPGSTATSSPSCRRRFSSEHGMARRLFDSRFCQFPAVVQGLSAERRLQEMSQSSPRRPCHPQSSRPFPPEDASDFRRG